MAVKVFVHFEYYQLTPRAQPQVRSQGMHILLCFIVMSEGLIKSMWTGLPRRRTRVFVGWSLGPGDGGDDVQEELDEESE